MVDAQTSSFQIPERNDILPVPSWTDETDSWLLINFPLLHKDCLYAALDLEFESRVSVKPVSQAEENQLRLDVERDIFQLAFQQLGKLCKIAVSPAGDSQQERSFLFLCLLQPDHLAQSTSAVMQKRAAEALKKISWLPSDVPALSSIITCLTRRMSLAESVRIDMLSAFLSISASGKSSSHLSETKIGEVLTEALLLELSREERDQSFDYCRKVLELLRRYRYPAAVPVLQAISETHWSEEIRVVALETLKLFSDSLELVWQSTGISKNINMPKLAAELEQAIKQRSEHLVRILFSATKGQATIIENDPRLPLIHQLLKAPDERLILAAAYAVLRETDELSTPTHRVCVEILASLAIQSTSHATIDDALALMGLLRAKTPVNADFIDSKCVEASERFVQKFSAMLPTES